MAPPQTDGPWASRARWARLTETAVDSGTDHALEGQSKGSGAQRDVVLLLHLPQVLECVVHFRLELGVHLLLGPPTVHGSPNPEVNVCCKVPTQAAAMPALQARYQ